MPGIVVTYQKTKTENSPVENSTLAEEIGRVLHHSTHLKQKAHHPISGVSMIINYFKPNDCGIFESDDLSLIWYGWPCYVNKPFDESILMDLKESFLQNKVDEWMAKVNGHFQIVLVSSKTREFYFFCDKTSALPVYFTETERHFVFSPEPLSLRPLKQYNWNPSIRQEAIYEFLASGHLWGEGTFWNEVQRLGPGRYVEISGDTLLIKNYFQMHYETGKENERDLEEQLFDEIKNDIKLLPSGKNVLALSGGYDSRFLMELLTSQGISLEVVSFSFGEDYSDDSDWGLAKYYAERAGLPFNFYKADLSDSSKIINNFKKAILASGGECDQSIAQDGFLGSEFFEELAVKYDGFIRGDHVWGKGDQANSLTMAYWENYLFNFNEFLPLVNQIVLSQKFEEGMCYISQKREDYSQECPSGNANAGNLKDYLYWRHRLARFQHSLGYFKRCYINHFAPFLFGTAFPVIQKTPGRLRNQKRLFLQVAKKEFPNSFINTKMANPYRKKPKHYELLFADSEFKSFVMEQMKDLPVSVGEIFDTENLSVWVQSTLKGSGADQMAGRQSRKLEYNIKKSGQNFLGKFPWIIGNLKPVLIQLGGMKYPHSNIYFLFRLLILNMTLKYYEGHESKS